MSFFAKAQHVSEWQAGPAARRPPRRLHRPGQHLPGPVAADQPDDGAVRGRPTTRRPGPAVASIKALFPLYPLTKGVDSWDLQRAIAFALTVARRRARPAARRGCATSTTCPTSRRRCDWIHAPDTWDAGRPAAQRRFRFDEALVTQLVLARRRAELAQLGGQARDRRRRAAGRLRRAAARSRSPAASRRSSAEIEADLARPHPMNRLLQGEVGSGKTLVALRAMLRVVDSGGQAALLAPTEVLAQQHLPLDHRDARRPRRRRHARRRTPTRPRSRC